MTQNGGHRQIHGTATEFADHFCLCVLKAFAGLKILAAQISAFFVLQAQLRT